MAPLFGTDGIRGLAGQPPLDPDTVSRIGSALVASLLDSGHRVPPIRVVVGCDTRESSPWIVASLNGGILGAGGSILFAGVVPTPAVAYLVRTLGADAGISVSASHNPWQDNGVKIFSDAGRKLFGITRTQRKVPNDADRLRKYLARFGLDWPACRLP